MHCLVTTMTDMHTRFRTLDEQPTPNLWHEIEKRAIAAQPAPSSGPWVLIAIALLLALALAGAALIGSGVVKLPVSIETSPAPSSTPASAVPSSTPVVEVAPTWTATASMIEARMDFTATRLPDGKVLMAGGDRGASSIPRALASAELYDPASGTWTATGSLITGRYRHSATLLADGTVLVAGGEVNTSASVGARCCLASAELYDPNTGTWTATGSMIEARADFTATLLLDGTVLVAGGDSALVDGKVPGAELYHPTTRSWTATGAMIDLGTGRHAHTAVLLPNGKVLVVGGTNGNAPPELYDPSSRSWSSLGCAVGIEFAEGLCDDPREWATAVLLADGRVLVTGELGAALYDSVTASWTATGDMNVGELAQTSVLLPNGKVLAVGVDERGPFAELYDPGTGSWNTTAGPIGIGSAPRATVLPDATVLVAGGFVGEFDFIGIASAELYDPGTD